MTISVDPRFFGSPIITWPALVAMFAIVAGVAYLVLRAPTTGASRSDVYAVAVHAVLWGIVGARLLHVVDYAAYYADVPFQAMYIWNGGFAAWGAVLGAMAGGFWHAIRRGLGVGPLANLATPPALAGLAAFRLGDFVTGQRPGAETPLPWGAFYTHPVSDAFWFGAAQHPVALYEMLLLLALGAFIVAGVRWGGVLPGFMQRLLDSHAMPGGHALVALAAYAAIRFVVGFARMDPLHFGLQQAQWIGLGVLCSFLAYAAWRRRQTPRRVSGTTIRSEREANLAWSDRERP